jgi:hypothetical protein
LVAASEIAIAQSESQRTDGKRIRVTARASELDPSVQSHPEIDFLLETPDGKPMDVQHASVDTRVDSQGRLVIWLMNHNSALFDRLNAYGLHAIQVHYANRWFSICCRDKPVGETCRGDIRLEAATGQDFSAEVDIPKADGMMERAFRFVKHLSETEPEGNWQQFLSQDGEGLDWEKVIVSGASHGSTTAARFAKHQRVARVVALCGPRDQFQTWQTLPSATPENRFFGFSHVLDDGWVNDHYCRSWELLGLNQFGPIVDVDRSEPPFENTRRLITRFDVDQDPKKAHSSVQPGKYALKDNDGNFAHDSVWRYMYTHPVRLVGEKTPLNDGCLKAQRQ